MVDKVGTNLKDWGSNFSGDKPLEGFFSFA